jgi:hypothetical protein
MRKNNYLTVVDLLVVVPHLLKLVVASPAVGTDSRASLHPLVDPIEQDFGTARVVATDGNSELLRLYVDQA